MKTFGISRVRTTEDAIDLLPTFLRGLSVLNAVAQPGREVTAETFCRVLFDSVAKGESGGHVALYFNAETPSLILGFSISYASNDRYR